MNLCVCSQPLSCFHPHLGVILVKCHDRAKEEEWEVEVVSEQVREGVVAILLLTVLQCKAHTAHDGEANASIEQDVLQVKRAGHQGFLQEESESLWAQKNQ